MAAARVLSALAALVLAGAALAFHLPRAHFWESPREFAAGDAIQVQLEAPHAYYSMPLCTPPEGVHRSTLSPAMFLLGTESSPYTVTMMTMQKGLAACNGPAYPGHAYPALTQGEVQRLQDSIKRGHRVRLSLDGLPITTYDLQLHPKRVRLGFEIGYELDGKFYINNHLMLLVLVNEVSPQDRLGNMASAATNTEAADQVQPPQKMFHIVGFEVSPCSIQRVPGEGINMNAYCPSPSFNDSRPQEVKEGEPIVYTYEVYWETSDITRPSRWNAYLFMPSGSEVHWFSILNSLMVVAVLSIAVARIIRRTIPRGTQHQEQLLMEKGRAQTPEQGGWQMSGAAVFQAPSSPLSLCVRVAAGLQIAASALLTLFTAAVWEGRQHYLSPALQALLLAAALVLYLLLSVVAGYSSVWLWGLVNRSYEGWRDVCWRAPNLVPFVPLAVLSSLHLLSRGTAGDISGALAGFILSIALLWLLIATLLSYLGGKLATKQEIRQYPTHSSQILPPTRPLLVAKHPLLLTLAAGLLPFGAIFVELYFALSSFWEGYMYASFDFAFLKAVLTVIITIQLSICCTYVQLCAQDYQWWWRSYHRGGSIAIYVLVYSLAFWAKLPHQLSATLPLVHYLTIVGLLAWCLSLALGSVGFLSSLTFTHAVFKASRSGAGGS